MDQAPHPKTEELKSRVFGLSRPVVSSQMLDINEQEAWRKTSAPGSGGA